MSAIEVMLQQPLAQAIGWALLQFVWQGTLIALLTAALLAALRRSAADVRYVVSTIALMLMLTIPIVTVMQTVVIEPTVSSPGPATAAARIEPSQPSSAGEGAPIAQSPADGVGAFAPGGRSLEPWLPFLVSAWLAGVAVLTLRLMSGWMWVQRMKSRGAVPAAAAVQIAAARLMRRLHIARAVRFLESPLVDVPTVIGWLKPVVLLPASMLSGLTPRQVEAILAHELAHIRRHDYLVNLLQTVVETLLFYHPAVWWLSRRIRIERENCCDDLAVGLCGDPVAYAAALADLEGLRASGRGLALAANGGALLVRVRRLLGAPSHAGRAPGWLAAGVALLVVVSMSVGALGRDVLGSDQAAATPAPPVEVTAPAPVVAQAPADGAGRRAVAIAETAPAIAATAIATTAPVVVSTASTSTQETVAVAAAGAASTAVLAGDAVVALHVPSAAPAVAASTPLESATLADVAVASPAPPVVASTPVAV